MEAHLTLPSTWPKPGFFLDIGCGRNKQQGFVGMDAQLLPGVDLVWDVNVHPWPLEDETVKMAMCSHLIEHIPSVAFIDGKTRNLFIEFMDEVWRILVPEGEFAIAYPHGSSQGFLQDPTHVHAMNESTWCYFDPLHPTHFYQFYQPKPWKIKSLSWNPVGNCEVVLIKRMDDRSYHE